MRPGTIIYVTVHVCLSPRTPSNDKRLRLADPRTFSFSRQRERRKTGDRFPSTLSVPTVGGDDESAIRVEEESHATSVLNSRSCPTRSCAQHQQTLSRPAFQPKVVTMASTSTAEQDPAPSLDDQDESVRIAVKALGDMRNSRPLPSSSNSIRVYNLPYSPFANLVSATAYHVQKSLALHRPSSRHHLRLLRQHQPTRPTMQIRSILSPEYQRYLS